MHQYQSFQIFTLTFSGSEHTLCGRYFPAELHLVHQGVEDPSKLAVLGVFLQLAKPEDEDGVALQVDAQALPKIKCFGQKVPVPAQELKNKLPKNQQSFVRYQGSLTTPPCSENVVWTVFTEPVTLTREQVNEQIIKMALELFEAELNKIE